MNSPDAPERRLPRAFGMVTVLALLAVGLWASNDVRKGQPPPYTA